MYPSEMSAATLTLRGWGWFPMGPRSTVPGLGLVDLRLQRSLLGALAVRAHPASISAWRASLASSDPTMTAMALYAIPTAVRKAVAYVEQQPITMD